MKIDLLNNENPLQPSSERQSENRGMRECSNEVMKEQPAQRFMRWRKRRLQGTERRGDEIEKGRECGLQGNSSRERTGAMMDGKTFAFITHLG